MSRCNIKVFIVGTDKSFVVLPGDTLRIPVIDALGAKHLVELDFERAVEVDVPKPLKIEDVEITRRE